MDASGDPPTRAEAFLEEAARHAAVGEQLPPQVRFRMLKRAILRAARVVTNDQAAFNRAMLAAVRTEVDDRMPAARAALTSIELAVQDAIEAAEQVQKELVDLRLKLFDLSHERGADRGELLALR